MDYRTSEERQEDYEGRLQPMKAIQEEATPTSKTTPAPPKKRRGCLWLALIVGVLAPALMCTLSMVVYMILPPPPLDLLVLGLDAREGEGVATRTDAIMLVGIQPRWMRVSLLSIPRDLFIQVPGYESSQRINTINVLGETTEPGSGPALLADAIELSFDVGVDRYARLNFDAFVQMVDAVGGIVVNVESPIVDNAYPGPDGTIISFRFEAGRQRMDGEAALRYARTRHGDDDYRRAARQQQVISALARQLMNPLNWPAAAVVLQQNIDTNLTMLDMATYAPPVIVRGGRFDQLVIDRDYITGGSSGAVPDYEKLRPWISARYD